MSEQADCPTIPPTAEHARLKESVGEWKVDCTFYMDPSQPPMNVVAKETVTMFGEYFATSVFESDMFGVPFTGRAQVGYDPVQKHWVSSWIDTMNPFFYHLTGNMEDGKLVMSGEAPSPMGPEAGLCVYKTVEEDVSPDKRVFEMFFTAPDGTEVKMFTHVYTR